jgi:chaperonin GroEL
MIYHGDEAKKLLFEGIDELANAVSVTLGPATKSVIIDRRDDLPPLVVNDGVTVARHVNLNDKMKNIGAKLMIEVANKAQQGAGDGTTSSIVIAQALIKECMELSGISGVQIRSELEILLKHTEEILESMSREIEVQSKDLYEVALVSANNDENIARLIDTAIKAIGKEGIITIEPSPYGKDDYKITNGYESKKGYISPLISKVMGKKKNYENPLLVFSNTEVNNFSELLPALEISVEEKRPIIFMLKSVTLPVINSYLMNQMNGNINACLLQAEDISFWQDERMGDLALLTGANFYDTGLNMKLESLTLEDMGTCGVATVGENFSSFVDFDKDDKLLEERLNAIEVDISLSDNEFYQKKYYDRMSRLKGHGAVIYIHGISEQEIRNKMDRIDDCLNATRAALNNGVVVGAGLAFYEVSNRIREELIINDITCAYIRAIESVFCKLYYNVTGQESKSANVYNNFDNGYVFNGRTREWLENDNTIIDPVDVVKSSLQAAVSVASYVMTADCIIGVKDEKMQLL